jgi:pimeloyl-ACP methyl ester carboxylesterase
MSIARSVPARRSRVLASRTRAALHGVLALILAACTSTQTRPVVDLHDQPIPGAVASLEPVTLGGVTQWILIRGASERLPLLLKLHGGPGQAEMATVGFNRALEQDFLVVEWDQRGSGKSSDAIEPASGMTLPQLVADTRELTELLLKRYHRTQLVLVGHSWGSVVGMKAVQAAPQLYAAFVSTGQIANFPDGQRASHAWLLAEADRRGDTKARAELEALGPPPFARAEDEDKRRTYGGYLEKFGAVWHASAPFERVTWMLHAPEYAWSEKLAFQRAAGRSWERLFPFLAATDLFTEVPGVEVPVHFAVGRFDGMAPTVVSERYFEALRAPAKSWTWFEGSAHFPQWEEADKFRELLVTVVAPDSVRKRLGGGN